MCYVAFHGVLSARGRRVAVRAAREPANAYPENGKLHKSPSSGPRSINMHQPRIGAFTLEIGVDASSLRRFLSLSLSSSLLSFLLPSKSKSEEETKMRGVCGENTLLPLYTCIRNNHPFDDKRFSNENSDIRNLPIPRVYKQNTTLPWRNIMMIVSCCDIHTR